MFRIVDLEGNQAVDTLFYNADDPEERYSAIDTIRRQGNLYLDDRHAADLQRRQRDADHRRRHLRPPRHARRRLRAGEQHRALRADKRFMHTCRDNFLLGARSTTTSTA